MNYLYPYLKEINLHVQARISEEDARRQEKTAREILKRLSQRPGVILADEVGMGKTFVALAVAVSVAFANRGRRPVVVMVPPSLRNKWPRDFELFLQKCLPEDMAGKIRYGCAERAVQFLKLLDDSPNRRKQIVFVTHGAMSRNLDDKWVKLAIVAHTIRGRWGVEDMRKALSRVLADLLHMPWVESQGQEIWEELLKRSSRDWLGILQKKGIDPEGDHDPSTDDDPVPEAVQNVLYHLDTKNVFSALEKIPKRRTDTYQRRLREARNVINAELRNLWRDCTHRLKLRLPLLILDEAHHLKNRDTKLASLFQDSAAVEDADQVTRGPLAGAFERMLFLTATPFQLGHPELCSVLERFEGISWNSRITPNCGRTGFKDEIALLRTSLDAAQSATLTLDKAWGHLQPDDLGIEGKRYERSEEWWAALRDDGKVTPAGDMVRQSYDNARRCMREAEQLLRPWVLRHLKRRFLPLPHADVKRRCVLPGRSIQVDGANNDEEGLLIQRAALLPFLLAARASTHAPESRPVFAEGLASSYQAFLQTRQARRRLISQALDGDDDEVEISEPTEAVRWYLDQLERLIPCGDLEAAMSHPKIAATVARVIDLWRSGEKVVVFCHYIATGKVLRQLISEAVGAEIRKIGSEKMGCPQGEVHERLERIGKRFFDEDSPIRKACDNEAEALISTFPVLEEHRDALVEVVRRNVRTPSFLVRYFPLHKQLDEEAMKEALNTRDGSDLCLKDLLSDFFRFLVTHCGEEDRRHFIEAVKAIQTGSHFGADVARTFANDELQGEPPERLVPNVRLVNGSTDTETRQRIMLTFNTPFYPEILITSNVLAEGVDLHLNCRQVIHHDLCWNPSTLEQRTGRIDRIGAKSERCGRSIHVYLPYIAETQDEKMYRVVMDRERWFSVVMGEQYKVDAKTVERLASRIPFPEAAAQELAFRLEVDHDKKGGN